LSGKTAGLDSVGVTVIIPTPAAGRGLTRAVASVLAQDGVDARLMIIIDGTPTDLAEQELLAGLGDPHRVVHVSKIGRPSPLRNLGLALTTTPVVAFLDDDDWWAAGKLRSQLAALSDPGTVMVGSNAVCVRAGAVQEPYHDVVPARPRLEDLLRTNWLITSSVVCDTRTLTSVGGFPASDRLRVADDYAAWLRVATVGGVSILDEPLVYYSADSPDSLSRNTISGYEMRRRVLDDYAGWSAARRALNRPETRTLRRFSRPEAG